MSVRRAKIEEKSEPMGIVIADGGNGELTSRFAAFVWGPVPDDAEPVLDEVTELASSAA